MKITSLMMRVLEMMTMKMHKIMILQMKVLLRSRTSVSLRLKPRIRRSLLRNAKLNLQNSMKARLILRKRRKQSSSTTFPMMNSRSDECSKK